MREMNEQKYSRNMALSLLAGIALGAVITLALLWALGYFPGKGQGEALETDSSPMAAAGEAPQLPDHGETASVESSESQNGTGQGENGSQDKPGQDSGASESAQDKPGPEEGSSSVSLDFRLNGGWDGEEGHYCQYLVSIINDSGSKITDWKITVPGFEGCRVDSYWCCELETEGENLIVTPADFNQEIWENSRVEGIGITVVTEKFWRRRRRRGRSPLLWGMRLCPGLILLTYRTGMLRRQVAETGRHRDRRPDKGPIRGHRVRECQIREPKVRRSGRGMNWGDLW